MVVLSDRDHRAYPARLPGVVLTIGLRLPELSSYGGSNTSVRCPLKRCSARAEAQTVLL
jgi:hypothetical protein